VTCRTPESLFIASQDFLMRSSIFVILFQDTSARAALALAVEGAKG